MATLRGWLGAVSSEQRILIGSAARNTAGAANVAAVAPATKARRGMRSVIGNSSWVVIVFFNCRRAILVRRPGLAERYQTALRVVPQRQAHATETLEKGQPADVAQFGMIAQDARQTVEGDAARQVMHE